MGIGSSLWAMLGDGSRWMHDFSTCVYDRIVYTPPSTGLVNGTVALINTLKMYQRPFNMWGTRSEPGYGERYNTGYFVWRRTASPSVVTDLPQVLHAAGGKGGSTNPRPQWKQLSACEATSSPEIVAKDIKSDDAWLNYHTGFIDKVGATRQTIWGTACDAFIICEGPKEITSYQHGLFHYNPWAWFGTVPQVIADIAMKCGVPRAMIDEASFDNAHDAYDQQFGDAPWKSIAYGGSLFTKYEIAAPRIVGETCVEMLLRCAAHSRDFYFTNEAGKLSCTSFTRPSAVSLTGAMLLTVGAVSWVDSDKYMWNIVNVTWGSAALAQGDFTKDQWNLATTDIPYSVQDEDRCETYLGDKLSGYYENTASVAKYGERPLRGRKVKRVSMGRESEVEIASFPYLLRCHTYATNALAAFQAWASSDGEPSRLVTMVQDFRALDWGVGSILLNLAVTADGATIPRSLCIRRSYDFDSLTVTSTLLQIPAL